MGLVIKRPLITEKNAILNTTGVYVFEVELAASKPEIKKAIETVFEVKVDSIRTIRCRSAAKANRFGRGKIARWKKAFVKLQPGEKIALFEGA